MRILIIFIIILFSINPCYSFSFLQKKDYKQNFINDALSAEKRHNNTSAFHLYEKALFYYKKDKSILEAYAGFCDRQKYFVKAQEIYQKLYVLTKNPDYIFKKNLSEIKNGNLTKKQVQKLTQGRHLNSTQEIDINIALIYYFSSKGDWLSTKKSCQNIKTKSISKDVIDTCIAASVKTKDKKATYQYLKRYYEIYPNNIEVIKKIIGLAEQYKDLETETDLVKKFSELIPYDRGIKYRLAGLYQKQGEYKKANAVYENLIASGDNSKYVKDSYAYSLTMSKGIQPKKSSNYIAKYIPKPLTPKELKEKAMYEFLEQKNYAKVVSYLNDLIKNNPNDTKLLKLRADMAMAQNDYPNAIIFFEKLKSLNYSLTLKDEKLLAFSYSKTDNYPKAIELVENLLEKEQNDKDLLNLALEYSMASKNWVKALFYTNKLLAFDPTSEKLLKSLGDIYATNKDFPNAIKSYIQLVHYHPQPEYYLALANFYMANENFAQAQYILEPLSKTYPDNAEITKALLNSFLAQQKICRAYWLIRSHHLENTKDGYIVFGDMAMMDKDFEGAKSFYQKALLLDPESLALQNKLASSYRELECLNKASQLYHMVLAKDPCNSEAMIGLGYLEIDKKNYAKSRKIFNYVLANKPCYEPAEIGIVNSYLSNDDNLHALSLLGRMPQDETVKLMQDQTHYKLNIHTNVFKAIPDVPEMNVPQEIPDYDYNLNKEFAGMYDSPLSRDKAILNYKKRRNEAVILTPTYSFMIQQLADQFHLNYQKGGINLSQNIDGNKNIFAGYNVIAYSTGGPQQLNNITHEFRAGIQARPANKWEYRADIGVKAFEYGDGAMLITDSWIKHYFNDNFNLKLGARRNNIEQSFLSAVGENIDGIFTGRAADNKFYLEFQEKLPRQCYAFGLGSYGVITAQNLITNQYFEGMLGVGRLLYYNQKNKWVNLFGIDLVSYNSTYQYNLLNIFSNSGQLFGGYFSPSFFSANTVNLKMEGHLNKSPLRYGVKGFGGIQTAITADQTTPTWGFSPYVAYDINDRISIYAAYNHFSYADLIRDQFMVNAVIRGFNNGKK